MKDSTGEIVDGGCPNNKRILEDAYKVVSSMQTIFEHDGAMVEGLGNRTAGRAVGQPRKKRGGKRPTQSTYGGPADRWDHPDAIRGSKMFSAMAKKKFEKKWNMNNV